MRIDEVIKKKTLYVSRDLLNTDDIVAWAVSQGLESMLDPNELHVTICYSKAAVSWDISKDDENLVVAAIDDLTEDADDLDRLRKIEMFGKDHNVLVLQFGSRVLFDRHYEFREHGCSSDFPDYKSHLTISYKGAKHDVDDIKPYRGVLEFGPEKFKEINTNWEGTDNEIDLTDPKHMPRVPVSDDKPVSEFWYDPHQNRMLTESLDDEASEDAFSNGWVRGHGNVLHGDKIAALRLAAAYLGERNYNLTLNLNGQWDVTLNPKEQQEFVAKGLLPESIIEEEQAPLPRKFWLGFHLPIGKLHDDAEEKWAQLEKGTLHGVQGISDRRDIVNQFGRDAVLVMDPAATVAINNLERFEYNNPEALVANDMAVLVRLWNRRPDVDGRAGAIERLCEYMRKPFKERNFADGYLMEYYGLGWKAGDVYKASPTPVETVSDLCQVVWQCLRGAAKAWNKDDRDARLRDFYNTLSLDDVSHCVEIALRSVGVVFSDEGEWAVRDETFNVPQGSTLLIYYDKEAWDLYQEYKRTPDDPKWKRFLSSSWMDKSKHTEELFAAFPGVKQRYNVRFIDARTYLKSRDALVARRIKAGIKVKL